MGGADALNVCFNALAILFLLQLDNEVYEYALDKGSRAEVEEHARLELDPAMLQVLGRVKYLNIVLVTVTIPIGLWLAKQGDVAVPLRLSLLVLIFSGIFEAV